MNYLAVKKHVEEIAQQCGRHAQDMAIVAVSKGQAEAEVGRAYAEGCRLFGESRLAEAIPKMEQTPQDIQWHLIGTLQKNKVRKAVEQKFALIHSVDSLELAQKISQCSRESSLNTPILLQVNISGEKSKRGMALKESYFLCEQIINLPHIQVRGLMTIAPLTEDEKIIRQCFRQLRELRDEWSSKLGMPETLQELSMGMSRDYPIAIQEGATLLRIGTAIFQG